MLHNRFYALAQCHFAVYDERGNTKESWIGQEDIAPKFDKFHVSYIHSSTYHRSGDIAYHLHELIPVFVDLIDFLEVICPQITAIHIQKLLDLVEHNTEQELICGINKYFINQYISIDTVYNFLQQYKYC